MNINSTPTLKNKNFPPIEAVFLSFRAPKFHKILITQHFHCGRGSYHPASSIYVPYLVVATFLNFQSTKDFRLIVTRHNDTQILLLFSQYLQLLSLSFQKIYFSIIFLFKTKYLPTKRKNMWKKGGGLKEQEIQRDLIWVFSFNSGPLWGKIRQRFESAFQTSNLVYILFICLNLVYTGGIGSGELSRKKKKIKP